MQKSVYFSPTPELQNPEIRYNTVQMSKYTILTYWLPKIPLLALIGTFLLPLALMQIHYETGLFFIALYISYWSVKVFESYYYVLKSYIRLLKLEKKDWSRDTIVSR